MKIVYMSNSVFILCATLLTSCAEKKSSETITEATETTDKQQTKTHANNLMYLHKKATGQDPKATLAQFLKDNALVVVDFYAPWCPPCCSLSPTLDKIAKQEPTVMFLKIDVDQYDGLSAAYNIRSMPTLIFFKNGVEVYRESGDKSASALTSLIKQHLR